MSEPMTVRVEVWPVAADPAGLWLLDHDAWRSTLPVPADSDPFHECKLLLAQHGLDPNPGGDVIELHGTSNRTEGPTLIATHYATVRCDGPVIEHWENAQPIQLELAVALGRAPQHGPTDLPDRIAYAYVLLHTLRHLRHQQDADTDCRALYEPYPLFRQHLAVLAPALAQMYGTTEAAA